MEKSGFFNAEYSAATGKYDREYEITLFAKYFSKFIGNGVFPNPSSGCQVFASDTENNTIVLKPGNAWTNGYWYENDSDLIKNIDPADATLNRIDYISIRYSLADRDTKCVVLKGIPAVNAVPPTYYRNNDYWDLIVGSIKMDAGKAGITQSMITDTRLDSTLCGQVAALVNQLDTTTWGNQLTTFINEFIASSNVQLTTILSQRDSEFQAWFNAMKDQLTTDAAGNLQTQIGILTNLKTVYKSNIVGASNELFNLQMFELNPICEKHVSFPDDATTVETITAGSTTYTKTIVEVSDSVITETFAINGVDLYMRTTTFNADESVDIDTVEV